MTQPVYSTQFYLGTLPTSWSKLFSVPAGFVYSLKDINLHGDALGARIQFGIGNGSGASSSIVIDVPDLGDTVYVWTGTLVMNPDDELVATTNGGGGTALVSGFKLTQT